MTSPRTATADLRHIPFGIRLASMTRAPRTAYETVVRAFRRSLEVRIVAITLLLSAFAMVGTGTYLTYTIGNGLFDARLQQVEEQSSRATQLAQSTFDTTTASDDSALGLLQLAVIDRIGSIATSYSGIAFLRAPGTQTRRNIGSDTRGKLARRAG